MLLTNAHLVSPGREIEDGWLEVMSGVISGVGEMRDCPGEGRSLEGKFLLPGFIDLHAHGADGADVCDGTVESLEHIAQAKLREGVATWLPTTLTQSPEKLREIFHALAEWGASGVHLEGPFINRKMVGAQNPEFVRFPDIQELKQLHQICPIAILSMAPELPGGMRLIQEARGLGMVVSAAHTKADYEILTHAIDHGLSHLTHFGNAMTGIHHREVGVVGGGLLEEALMLELICDGIHLAPEFIEMVVKAVGIERVMVITDSMRGAGNLGGMEVVVEEGVARLKEGGALAGSIVKFNEAVKVLMEATGRSLGEVVAATSWNQARSLGLRDRGKLEVGMRGDLVVLDRGLGVVETFVGGG